MKKILITLLVIAAICSLCACGGSGGKTGSSASAPQETTQQPATQPTQEAQSSVTMEQTGEAVKELYGYLYSFPETVEVEGSADGAVLELKACDIFLYKIDYLEFNTWDNAVEQCKSELYPAYFSAFSLYPVAQSATTEAPFTNAHGVEMMRATGELEMEKGEIVPYIAYYYVTDENYVRFILSVNYENEADAAKVIDYVAEHLEKA